MSNISSDGPIDADPNGFSKASLILWTLMAGYITASLSPVLSSIQADFADVPHSGPLTRFLVSGLGVGIIIGSPLATLAAERFGRRRVLILSLISTALFGALGGTADNLAVLVGCRLLTALGAASCGILLLSIVATMTEQARNQWLGWLTTLGTSAVLLIVPFAGALGSISWRLVFVVHLLALLLIPLVMRGLPGGRPEGKSGKGGVNVKPIAGFVPPMLLVLGLLIGAIQGVPQMFLPFQLRAAGIVDPATVGMVMMASLSTTVMSSALYGAVRRRFDIRATFVGALLLSGLGYATIGLAGSLLITLAGLALMGAGAGLLIPHINAVASTAGPPEGAARIMGFTRSAFYCGPLLAQIILEPFVARSDAGVGLLILGGLVLVATVAMRWIAIPHFDPAIVRPDG